MSRTNTNTTQSYRPVEVTLRLSFDSNIVNDDLRSPNWWRSQIEDITGITDATVTMTKRDVRCRRSSSDRDTDA